MTQPVPDRPPISRLEFLSMMDEWRAEVDRRLMEPLSVEENLRLLKHRTQPVVNLELDDRVITNLPLLCRRDRSRTPGELTEKPAL